MCLQRQDARPLPNRAIIDDAGQSKIGSRAVCGGSRLVEELDAFTDDNRTAVAAVRSRFGGSDLKAMVPDLEWALQASIETLQLVSTFDFPDHQVDYEMVCLRHPDEFPMNEGRVVSSRGLDVPVEEYENFHVFVG